MPPRRVRRAQVSAEISNNRSSQEINQEGNPNEGQGEHGRNFRDQQPENPLNMFVEFLRQHINVVPEPNRNQNPDVPNNALASSFKAFQSLRPPEFKGITDPVEARAWLERVGEIIQNPTNCG